MRKKLALLLLAACAAVGFVTAGAVWTVRRAAVGKVYDDPQVLPVNDVGLVLGTSTHVPGGGHNLHFDNRVAAAAKLYQTGRVRHLLLSGDNGTRGYNEPADMRRALLDLGVPDDAMTLDYAGFRTLDSVVRARAVFGQHRLTIITDRFHAYRAVFLAMHNGLDIVAFPSQEIDLRTSLKSRVREWGADLKACLDLWVLHTSPKFLGQPIAVQIAKR